MLQWYELVVIATISIAKVKDQTHGDGGCGERMDHDSLRGSLIPSQYMGQDGITMMIDTLN